jgi:anti-anti-sigma factor
VDAVKSFEFERQAAYTRLALRAELNAFHWEELQQSAQEILAELENGEHRVVIVDLSLLDYLGSAQLTLLVRIWKLLKGRDARMIVELKSPVVREVLKTAGLLNVWEVADSHDAAFQMLGLLTDGRRKMSLAVPVTGLVALAGAVAGACLLIWPAKAFDPRAVLIAELSCSAVALGAGLWTAIRGSGARRSLGVGMVVASALLAVGVGFIHPRAAAPTGKHERQSGKRKPGKSDKKGTASAPAEGGSKAATESEAATESDEP